MSRFDLGMSINYCPQWGIVEAVREYFQNAFDAQTADASNKMYFEYDENEEVLRIGNKNGLLNPDTLLLGKTTKTDNEKMIGQHGEGYKVATVVLLRNGKEVTVYNRSKKEVWTAKIIKSRKYQAQVVVFDIEKVSIFKSVPDHDLIFEIKGISAEEFEAIKESNLHIQEMDGEIKCVKSSLGRILTGDKYHGKLFVGGLYVTTSQYATMGYDFDPSLVKLDRDRSFIDGIDLQFICGKVISATNDIDFIKQMKDNWDGRYIRYFLNTYCKSDFTRLYDEAYEKFKIDNGSDAVPTTDTSEFNRLKRNGFNAVMVTDNEYHYITSSSSYSSSDTEETESNEDLADKLESWFSEYIEEDSDAYREGADLIAEIIERLKE